MAYSTTTNDGIAVAVSDGNKDSTQLSLTLIGRNATNYGQSIVENTVRHLENFASLTAPTPTILPTGQLWYDKTTDAMRVYDGSTWKTVSTFVVSTTNPSTHLTAGTGYVNSYDDHLKIYDGANWRNAVLPGGTVTSAYAGNVSVGNPNNYGAKVETLFLTESSGSIIPVLALKYVSDSSIHDGETADPAHGNANATIMAIFSERSFSVSSSDPYYTELFDSDSMDATIVRGMNLRNDYTGTIVAQAYQANQANSANGLFVTSSVIPAADFIHVGRGYVPDSSGAYTLGDSSKSFAHTFTDNLTIGDAGALNSYLYTRGNVIIGNASSEVNHIYTKDITISGVLTFPTRTFSLTGDVTGSATFNGSSNATITTTIAPNSITLGTDTTGNYVANITAGSYTSVTGVPGEGWSPSVSVDATTAATPSKVVARDAAGNVAANYFVGTATAARYADLAENYEADAEYGPGTVVKIGGDKEITQTTDHADTNVFGVISSSPAYLMNADSKGLPVALQGRVPVRVIGTIKKGERLVSSDVPGVAWGVANDDVSIQAIIGRSLVDKDDSGLGVVEAVIGVK